MQFGIVLPTRADSWRIAQRAEALGVSHAWFYDTALLNAEIFVAMGAAAVKTDRIILATGYNGSIRGLAHCDDEGHMMEDGHCVRTVHAEANAIAQAARNGVRLDAAAIYITASPCFGCFKLIANAGLSRIVFGEFYRDERIFDFSKQLSIELTHVAAVTPMPAEGGP